jgi:hypothetical protein
MRKSVLSAFALTSVFAVSACSDEYGDDDPTGPALPQATVVTGAGDVTNAVAQFRALLGDPVNTGPGAQAAGRREINWDGVPDSLAAPNAMPGDFFNPATGGRARGAIFSTTAGATVQVSADSANAANTAVLFGNINPAYANYFKAFSQQRLFAAVGSNILDVEIVIPGTTTPALTRGFGVVYTDVDGNSTTLEFYDKDNRLIGTFTAPPSDGSFSFVGAAFQDAIVRRVRIKQGNAALGPNDGGNVDVVATDDFFFGEPKALTP